MAHWSLELVKVPLWPSRKEKVCRRFALATPIIDIRIAIVYRMRFEGILWLVNRTDS